MAVKRYENIILDRSRAVRLDNGMLRVPARLTRVGVFLYAKSDGKVERAFRPPEEVFSPESIATFDMVPLTNDHPPVSDMCSVTAENFKKLVVGMVHNPKAEGNFLEGTLMVSDALAVADVMSGKQELSCGYFADRDETPGVWEGQPYDFVQRNIRGNHVAIVRNGRAGPDVRIQLDSSAAIMVDEIPSGLSPTSEGQQTMEKITIDGLDFSVDATVKQALQKERDLNSKMLDAAKAEKEKLAAQCDSATAKVADLEKQLQEAPAKLRAELSERLALESKAKSILGAEFKADGLDDTQVKKAVVAKLSTVTCDGKSAEYINAAFEIALAENEKKNPVTEAVDAAQAGQPKNQVVDSAESPRKKAEREFFNPSKK